nr:NapC/NirT family cytochrome c [Salidesulfovibrio brasiliensis]
MAYYTMVRTSTPEFCASCHEIQAAYMAWKTSSHVNNPQGSLPTAWTVTCLLRRIPSTSSI